MKVPHSPGFARDRVFAESALLVFALGAKGGFQQRRPNPLVPDFDFTGLTQTVVPVTASISRAPATPKPKNLGSDETFHNGTSQVKKRDKRREPEDQNQASGHYRPTAEIISG